MLRHNVSKRFSYQGDVATPRERLLRAVLGGALGAILLVALKDIGGARDRETEAVVRWMIEALVTSALRENRRVG